MRPSSDRPPAAMLVKTATLTYWWIWTGSVPWDFFEYSRLKLHIAELLGNSADVVNRQTLKPLLRDNILHDAVDAF